MNEEAMRHAARQMESAAETAKRSAGLIEDAVQQLRVLFEDGYGGNALKLIELLDNDNYRERATVAEQKLAEANKKLADRPSYEWFVEIIRSHLGQAADVGPQRLAQQVKMLKHRMPTPPNINDAERMEWLVGMHVEVRTPMVYGSHALFTAQSDNADDEEHHTTLRQQIDAAIKAGDGL